MGRRKKVITLAKDDLIKDMFVESTKSDSSLYEKYTFRPYNPDELYQKNGNYNIFDEMREDDQISAMLHLKKLFILDSKWEIETENDEVKEFLEYAITCTDESLDKNLYNILSALDYGFSLTEKIFAIDEQNKIVLKRLKTRAPHSFTIYQDEYGNITEVRQDTSTDTDEIKIDPAKFIHFVYQREFDNPYGRSELNKGIYTDWWSKQAIMKFWNIYLERFGMPTAWGKYPTQYAGLKDDLKNVLKNIQSKTSIVTPAEVQIELLESSKEGGAFQAAINYYNTAIARKMLIPDLMGFSGQQISGGSYALGREQFGMFYAVIETIRNELERVINIEIIKPLLDYNFTGEEAEFKFKLVDEKKKAENLALWLQWVGMGKPISDEATTWFYEQIEVPEGELKPQQTGFDDTSFFTTDEKKNESEYNPELYTAKTDFKVIENALDTQENKLKKNLESVFKQSIAQILEQAKEIIKTGNIEAVNEMEVDKKKIKTVMQDAVKESYKSGQSSAEVQLKENEEILSDDEIATWLSEYGFFVANEEADYILKQSKPIISNGIRQGLGISQIVSQLEDKFTEIGYGVDGGTARLENVARTTISTAYNEGRFREYEKIESEIKGYFYSAILDRRTSDICKKLDSDRAGIYKPEDGRKINPPNHYQCRSVLIPVFNDEDVTKWAKIPSEFESIGGFFKIR